MEVAAGFGCADFLSLVGFADGVAFCGRGASVGICSCSEADGG